MMRKLVFTAVFFLTLTAGRARAESPRPVSAREALAAAAGVPDAALIGMAGVDVSSAALAELVQGLIKYGFVDRATAQANLQVYIDWSRVFIGTGFSGSRPDAEKKAELRRIIALVDEELTRQTPGFAHIPWKLFGFKESPISRAQENLQEFRDMVDKGQFYKAANRAWDILSQLEDMQEELGRPTPPIKKP